MKRVLAAPLFLVAGLIIASCGDSVTERTTSSGNVADASRSGDLAIEDLAARFTGIISGNVVSGGDEPVVLAENAADDESPAEIAQLARVYKVEVTASAGPHAPEIGEIIRLTVSVPITSQAQESSSIDLFELPAFAQGSEITTLVGFDHRLQMWAAGNGRTLAITPPGNKTVPAFVDLPSRERLLGLESLLSPPRDVLPANDLAPIEIEGDPPTTLG